MALPIQRGGVVDDKEYFQNLARADPGRIKHKFDHLVVARAAGAYLLVAGLNDVSVAVAALHVFNTFDTHKHRFGAPKTSPTESDNFSL